MKKTLFAVLLVAALFSTSNVHKTTGSVGACRSPASSSKDTDTTTGESNPECSMQYLSNATRPYDNSGTTPGTTGGNSGGATTDGQGYHHPHSQ